MPWQPLDDETPMFTYAMMAVFIAVFGAQATNANLAMLHVFPWRVGNGEIWRLVTSTAMHGSLLHFAFNMFLFVRFSTAIERWLGPWMAMAMYIFFALGSSAAELLWSGWLAVGASGVVYGYFGFLWVARRRYDVAAEVTPPATIQIMLAWLVICAIINMAGGHIANTAHVWGLLMGWLLGQAVVAKRVFRPIAIGGLAVVLLLPVALTYRPVFEKTLARVTYQTKRTPGRVPVLGRMYRATMNLPPEIWEEVEREYAEQNPLGRL